MQEARPTGRSGKPDFKRRYRVLNGERRLVVIPKRIRLGIEQRPHPGERRG